MIGGILSGLGCRSSSSWEARRVRPPMGYQHSINGLMSWRFGALAGGTPALPVKSLSGYINGGTPLVTTFTDACLLLTTY